jgi:hypothetical protein
MTKTIPCLTIQEEIAWGRSLSTEAQVHVLGCPSCGALSLEFARLDSLVRDVDIPVSPDFADRVMAEIRKDGQASTFEWYGRFLAQIGGFFQMRAVQVALAALVFAFPFSGAH